MTEEVFTQLPWAFKHDQRRPPIVPDKIVASDSVSDLIARLSQPEQGKRYKACGSHWALSTAAVADDISLETNFPVNNLVPRLSGLAVDLGKIASDEFIDYLVQHPPTTGDAIASDPCLQYRFGPFFVHLNAGTRIYEAYSLLDRSSETLNNGDLVQLLKARLAQQGGQADAYDGPWAFATLGAAGGQTVFGALTTGTHGGDYRQGPISDYVAALHLVGYGGQQFWVEPTGDRQPVPIADLAKLRQHYPEGPGNQPIKLIRDSDILDAIVVGVGRFGVVTSIVLAVVPQYCLLEHRDLSDWSSIKSVLLGPHMHHFYDGPYFGGANRTEKITEFENRFDTQIGQISNRFLQIAVNICPHKHNEHRCGVTQRWWVSPTSPEATNADGSIPGREERGTVETAGNSFPYEPPNPSGGDKPKATGTFLGRACADGSFIAGILRALSEEIEKIIADGFVAAANNPLILAALAIGIGTALLGLAATLCATLAATVVLLKASAEVIDLLDDSSLASTMRKVVRDVLAGLPKPVALMVLRCVYLKLFETQQGNRDVVAISYAVMDTHDYHDRSCNSDAQSIEVFFDANRPDIYCAYLDQILAFEGALQNNEGLMTIGYVSLRYVGQAHALIAPARYPETVVIEIAEIRQDDGSSPYVNNAAQVARHPIFAAPFHWGQFNPLKRDEVDRIFNSPPKLGALNRWREVLEIILSEQAVKDGFSSSFTRQTGLEPF